MPRFNIIPIQRLDDAAMMTYAGLADPELVAAIAVALWDDDETLVACGASAPRLTLAD